MRGYQQVAGEHYNDSSISSPVTNYVTIQVMMVLMLMVGWVARLVNMKGAFLHVEFDNQKTGFVVSLEGAIVAVKSRMQKIVALSVMEVELIVSVQYVQKMLFVMKVIELLLS